MPHQCTNCGRTFADGSKEMLSGCPDCSGTKFQFRPDGFDDADDSETPSADASASPGGHETTDPTDPSPPADSASDAVSRTVGSAAATVRDLVGGAAGPDATEARPPDSGTRSDAAGSTPAPDSSAEDGLDDDIIVAESEPVEDEDEDTAQADARSRLADPADLPEGDGFDPATDDAGPGSNPPASGGTTPDPDAGPDPSDGSTGATETPATGGSSPGSPDSSGEAPAGADDGRAAVSEPDAERADRPDLAQLREELNEQFESIRVVEPGQYELNLMELYDREEYIIALQEDGRYSIQVPESWRQADV